MIALLAFNCIVWQFVRLLLLLLLLRGLRVLPRVPLLLLLISTWIRGAPRVNNNKAGVVLFDIMYAAAPCVGS